MKSIKYRKWEHGFRVQFIYYVLVLLEGQNLISIIEHSLMQKPYAKAFMLPSDNGGLTTSSVHRDSTRHFNLGLEVFGRSIYIFIFVTVVI